MAERDETKARLLEAAGEEFAAHGFDGASIRAICRRARANIAAVNYHFGDKEQLYAQAVLEAHRCATMSDRDPILEDAPAADQLRSFIRNFLSKVLSMSSRHDDWHNTLMLRELLRPSRACETLVREAIRPKFETLTAILRRVCPEAEPQRLHVIGFSVVGQCLHYRMGRAVAERLIGPEEFASLDVDYLTDHIANFSLAALGLGPPLGAEGRPVEKVRRERPLVANAPGRG